MEDRGITSSMKGHQFHHASESYDSSDEYKNRSLLAKKALSASIARSK
jgi:hypothetical protein